MGCAFSPIPRGQGVTSLLVEDLFVRLGFRRKEIGKGAAEAHAGYCPRAGGSGMRREVVNQNTAIDFYRSLEPNCRPRAESTSARFPDLKFLRSIPPDTLPVPVSGGQS